MSIKARLLKNKTFILLLLIGMAVTGVLPLILQQPFDQHVMVMMLIWCVMGMGWNFIGGYAGQVSNGHALFMAIGAYTTALTMKWLQLTPWISIWIGCVISAGFAFIIGKPLLKLRGHYFAVATMAVAECARIILLNLDVVGGATGVDYLNRTMPQYLSLQFSSKIEYYYIFLALTLLVLILVKILDKSKFGYYLRAIKGNEDSAQCVGIDTAKFKVWAYMLSAAVVSIGGSMYATYILYIDPYVLMPLSMSMMICLVAIMGGVGSIIGPILGAIVLTAISQYTTALFATINGLNLFLYGVLVIIMVLFLPDGLVSLFKRRKRKSIDESAPLATQEEEAAI